MIKLSPSLLAANPLTLLEEAKAAVQAECDELHFDVMDAHFVPNLTFGPHILKALKETVNIPYDVHLMLSDPFSMIEPFANAGADLITVHQEAADPQKCLQKIRSLGIKTGLSVKPATKIETILDSLPIVDRVLLMTVEPGFGGQKLMESVLTKAEILRKAGFVGEIQADGGINASNASQLVKAGIDVLVMGTAFFKAPDPKAVADTVHSLS